MTEKKKTREQITIEESIKKIIDPQIYQIIDIEFNSSFLTIFLYKCGQSIDVYELGQISKKIYPILDNLDFIKENFSLEVSSPGIFRKIKYLHEFDIFKDKNIKLSTQTNKTIKGKCQGLEKQYLKIIDSQNQLLKINIDEIKKASLNG